MKYDVVAICKDLSPDGRTLLASTFFGNGGSVRRISVNVAGELAILGSSFITTTASVWTAIKPVNNSDFVAKLNPLLQIASFATYVPAAANSIAIVGTGNVYVVGQTNDPAFVVAPGAIKSTLYGPTDGFVTKLSVTGQVIASTLIGGNAARHMFEKMPEAVKLVSVAFLFIAVLKSMLGSQSNARLPNVTSKRDLSRPSIHCR
jgi:hypothetical protein